MSSGKLTITIDGDEAKAHAAYMSLTKDQKALVAEIGKMGITAETAADKTIQAARKESKERQDQIRLAQQLVKSNESLSQAYDRQKKSLDAALGAGEITAEQHKQTLESLGEQVRQNSTEFIQAKQREVAAARTLQDAEKLAAKEREALDDAAMDSHNRQIKVAKDLVRSSETISQSYHRQKQALDDARAAGAITFSEHSQALKKLQVDTDKAAQKLGEIEMATEQGVGAKSLRKVVDFAAGFGTLAAAVGAVRKAIEYYNAEKEKAIGSTESLDEVRRSLRQVSKGDLDQLEERSEGLTQYGIDRVAARQLVFDARSMGFEGEESTVAKADPVINIRDGAAFAGEFRKFFSDENMSIEQSFNTALAAAAESQKNISGILPQIRTAAQGRLAGGESSDIAAAVAVLVDKFGDSTGDRVRNLGIELAANEQTRGLNMIDAMKVVLSDTELRKEIEGGSKEVMAAVKAFEDFLSKIEATDKRIEMAQQASPEKSLIRKATEEALDTDTQLGKIEVARRRAVSEAARLENENEKARAQEAYRAREAVDKVKADSIERGDGIVNRAITGLSAEALSKVASGETIEANSRTARIASPAAMIADPVGTFDAIKERGVRDGQAIGESIKSWLFGSPTEGVVDELKKQTTAMERQTSAIERLNQFQGV